jgi:hypothetical protein
MARTTKQKPEPNAGLQAPTGAWTPDGLMSVFHESRTDEDRIAALKNAGIIDAQGNLTQTYENWGTKVTRTPDADA